VLFVQGNLKETVRGEIHLLIYQMNAEADG